MAAPDWVSYGAVGISVGSLVLGVFNYRRTSSIKAFDVRLALRKDHATLHASLGDAANRITDSRESRRRVNAARGLSDSGNERLFLSDLENDLKAVMQMRTGLPYRSDDFVNLSPSEMEALLVEYHRMQTQCAHYLNKYQVALDADDNERDRIRDERSKVFNA